MRLLILMALAITATRLEAAVINDCESLTQINLSGRGTPIVMTETLVAGQVGQAVQIAWPSGYNHLQFAEINAAADASWNAGLGFSFWVKGDGSNNAGCLYVEAGGARFAAAFTINHTDFRQKFIPWQDLLPDAYTGINAPSIGPTSSITPSQIDGIYLLKSYYWRDRPAITITIDQFAVETSLPVDTNTYEPTGDPLTQVKAKFAARQPVTIVGVGDSLLWPNHGAQSANNTSWLKFLETRLEARYPSLAVTINNQGYGGDHLTHGGIKAPVWLQTIPTPDLIVVEFGYNDVDDGATQQMYQDRVVLLARFLRRKTLGASNLLFVTGAPNSSDGNARGFIRQAVIAAGAAENFAVADTWAFFNAIAAGDLASFYHDDAHPDGSDNAGTPIYDNGQDEFARIIELKLAEANGGGTATGGTATAGTATAGTATAGTATAGTATAGTATAGSGAGSS
nr:SGNH/GDSL hydrolase family protein [Planctomycetota bacterium]